ncbi:MAG: deoxyribonuclease IV [Thermoleophilia bacterium]|nr:deoxyribonuclease IV [Thermoleophilia bacterium]
MLYGGHVSSSGGIHTAIDRIEALGGDAVQLFTQSPRTWRPTRHDPASLARFRQRRAGARVGYALCHALYLINLASPDDGLRAKSETALRSTLAVARELDADVVFHVGSHREAGFEAGIERVLPALERALGDTAEATWLLLENTAGAGNTIGRSIAELAVLIDRLDRHPRLGLCLDTCHLCASGTDVTDPDTVERLLAEVAATVGLDRLRALHVNDSAAPLGSNRDRHANLGDGELGDGLAVFLAHPALQELPAILETPGPDGHGPDRSELEKLRALHERGLARR